MSLSTLALTLPCGLQPKTATTYDNAALVQYGLGFAKTRKIAI